jgi:DNA-binding response OmpR family regulator
MHVAMPCRAHRQDEFLVRMGTRAAVETAGFDVIEAGDADEAIAIRGAQRYSYHLYRHSHAGFDGRAEARPFVRDRCPPVKIVATSGRAKVTDSDLPEGGRFLPKPYSAAEIMATLHELIQG